MPGKGTWTIERHFMLQEKSHPEAKGEFTQLLMDIALAGKIISREVNKAGLVEILGLTGEINIQGEQVQKLDDFANKTLISILDRSGRVCMLGTEENTEAIKILPPYTSGHYAVSMDPLDGSSNIDVNVSVGTIFSIHRKVSKGPRGEEADLLQTGRKQLAAGYIIYGSSTMMVYTTGNGVHGFTLDPSVGEFLLSHPDIRIPKRGNTYSVNEGNYLFWSEGTKRYIKYLKEMDNQSGRPYTSRYIGSLVSDFHRNLLHGGIFLYPSDQKDHKRPHGKLRLLYEAAPMAYIVDRAGGYASDGKKNILDLEPKELHQRTPLIVGSYEDVKEYEEFIAEYDKEKK
ncbi:fructose-bisphosphatase class I [candidate division LCP-89 bacterium B3_LCP]|uniref:Fructose-1,6-bisphosphatase class 1 n=1 Tax=candidate division LCP-89 bacterium B3_LCP TaxID=2012998 RepID=A0A532V3P0_UNCL8|nr:MAG: fructose-bisphosphatase class I [candidate division LCP-89 bacterium B3_LCP]